MFHDVTAHVTSEHLSVLKAVSGKIFLSSPKRPEKLWGPPSFLCYGHWGSWPGMKRQFNHSPPSRAEVKNEWSHIYAPSIRLHGMEQGKHCYFRHYFSTKVIYGYILLEYDALSVGNHIPT